MEKDHKNIKLGIFVLAGTVLVIASLYLIGNKQNLFGNTIKINARFYNVNGLMVGNNVRFSGIDVGTVESIEIMDDSLVNVSMVIEKKIKPFIKKNSLAAIGTDGLMGNKLVNINAVNKVSAVISEGDVLETLKPIETDEMLRTLNSTNSNIEVISSNLRSITNKISDKNNLWNLLLDTVVAENIKSSVYNVKVLSKQAIGVTNNLNAITGDLRQGKGAGVLLTDTVLPARIKSAVVKIDNAGDSINILLRDVSQVVNGLKKSDGSVGALLNDTSLANQLDLGVKNLNKSAESFNENMEALHYSWPFKKYFKKKNKKIK